MLFICLFKGGVPRNRIQDQTLKVPLSSILVPSGPLAQMIPGLMAQMVLGLNVKKPLRFGPRPLAFPSKVLRAHHGGPIGLNPNISFKE